MYLDAACTTGLIACIEISLKMFCHFRKLIARENSQIFIRRQCFCEAWVSHAPVRTLPPMYFDRKLIFLILSSDSEVPH